MAGDLRAVRLAGIDIGTNTVLLLVAEADAGGRITPLAEEQETPRLGKEVDSSGRIRESGFEHLAGILARYREIALSYNVSRIAVCATSALRNASNREDILRYVRETAGVDIEVIDGATEADLTFRGALSRSAGQEGMHASPADMTHTAVLDIGGGSTELCHAAPGAAAGGRELRRISMEIGSVRLTERFFRHSPPRPEEIALARAGIIEAFAGIDDPGFTRYSLVAVAGTAVTLAGLHLGLRAFDREKLEGCRLAATDLHAMSRRLLGMDTGTVRSLSELTAGREDILAAGALILSCFADIFGFREVIVSTRGLRYGIVLRELERMEAGTGADAGN